MDLQEYEEGLDKASEKAKKSSSSISGAFGKIASGVGTVMKTAVKVTAGAIAGATAGVVALTTQAVKSYAEYEQLTGGIKKLYGNMGMTLDQYADHIGSTAEEAREEWEALEHSQNKVLQNANNAYKTAGLTANQYINSVTGFSSALINSVGKDYEKAGDLADMAMQDIADNANTFGKYTVEELTGVYQALAKGQYMTLDNLNLGYGGTKEGMQQLIDKANELKRANGEMGDLSIEKFSDMVEAIHLVQNDLNITGTTAREASSTIEGSLNMLKASWGNLVTGLADKNADLDGLMQNVVDSIVGYTDDAGKHVNGVADNIIPVVETALKSIATLIQKLVPEALGLIPTLIKEVLPKLTESATTLVQGLVDAPRNADDGNIQTIVATALVCQMLFVPEVHSSSTGR